MRPLSRNPAVFEQGVALRGLFSEERQERIQRSTRGGAAAVPRAPESARSRSFAHKYARSCGFACHHALFIVSLEVFGEKF